MTPPAVQGFPLSMQQRRLWQLGGGDTGLFRGAATLRCPEPVGLGKLRAAIAAVVADHEILRTRLVAVSGLALPLQVVAPAGGFGWSVVDRRALAARAGARGVDPPGGGWVASKRPSTEGPLDALLVREADGSSTLSLRASALHVDAAGLRRVLVEVAELAAGAPSRADEPLQYVDFAAWQDEVLADEEMEAERAHWLGLDPDLLLATRPPYALPAGSNAGAFAPRFIGREAPWPDAAGGPASRIGTSGHRSFLLAAWAAVLGRTTGRDRLAIGVYFDGRIADSLATVAGPVGRSLPLVCDLVASEPFSNLAARVEAALHAAGELQECFAWDQAANGKLGNGTYLACGFELVAADRELIAGGESRFLLSAGFALADRWEASLRVRPSEGAIHFELGYDAGRFAPGQAARLLGQVETLWRCAGRSPETPIGDLDLLAAEDREAVRRLNDAADETTSEATIPGEVAAALARSPHRIALVQGSLHLSAGWLDRAVEALARRLRSLGLGVEDRVAVCAERTPELVVGLLAILRAGAAYVPLDPEAPAERLEDMLEDSRSALLWLGVGAPAVLAKRAAAHSLADEIGAALATAAEGGAPLPPVDPDTLAYTIYTSGSTGRPKGVAMSHRGIFNRLDWMRREGLVGDGDCVLQKTPAVFDASIWELFLPLLLGARMVLAAHAAHRDAAALVLATIEEGITVLQVVPSLLAVLVAEPRLEEARSLRRLFAGGEALPPDVARRFRERSRAELHNTYGPTECAIDATHLRCTDLAIEQPAMPIGRSIANVSVYVVDGHGALAVPGLEGELMVGGVGLARAYVGRADLTAERFVPDPFGSLGGARLYRTGDRVRLGGEGTLDYLGRMDGQVKIRGYRVEPGEVEALLREVPGVREAVVVAPEDPARGRWLSAFFVAEPEAADLDADPLVRHLSARLPAVMMPARFERLTELPRLAGGKLDRRSLTERAAKLSAEPEDAAAPEGPVEELVAGIWSELLGVGPVAATANFFALGGHSLLATQTVSRVRAAIGVEVPLIALFQAPTVRQFAARVEEARRSGIEPVPPIEPQERSGDPPLSFAQQRLWLLASLDPGSVAYHLALAFRLGGALDRAAFRRSLQAIVDRHEILRTTFPDADGVAVQRVEPAAPIRIPTVDYEGLPSALGDRHARGAFAAAIERPFDLAEGPLWRCLLVRHGKAEHSVVLALHHIIWDGWSSEVLLGEFARHYAAFAAGADASPLPALPIQYADFALWQRRWLTGSELERQLAYWRGRLGGALPVLELPTDRARPMTPSYAGRRRSLGWPASSVAGLIRLGRESDSTLFMTLLAGLVAVLARYGRQDDVTVGSPIANRARIELEGLLGFFANTLTLRVQAPPGESFGGLLRHAREACLGASLHQDLPFERILEEVAPERDLSRAPLFQVMLVLQNAQRRRHALGNLRLEPVEATTNSAKFDLTLDLLEERGEIRGEIEYALDLFDPSTVARFEGHLRRLLEAAAEHPEHRLTDLPWMAPGEVGQLVAEWNDRRRAAPAIPVLSRFLAAAADSPEAVAVVWRDRHLTFGELAFSAARLAARLIERGVGVEDRVALCLEPSLELPAALLGVWQAGAAYVPVDPRYPAQRLAAMAEDAGWVVQVTEPGLGDRLPEGAQTVFLSSLSAEMADGTPRSSTQPIPESLAYVLFTSGSTGRPKGVQVAHCQLAALLEAACRRLGFEEGERPRMPASTSLSFDISGLENFLPLILGGVVVMVDREVAVDGRRLATLAAEEAVTVLQATPAGWRLLLEGGWQGARGLRAICGGEAWSRPLAEAIGARAASVWNGYGPTETTIYSSFERVPIGIDQPLSIGRPLAGTACHVLDPELRPLPIGVAGELWIGGRGVARGYLRRPDLTAERFLPDPWADEPGARLYRTGDLVRRRPDGRLVFLGRVDHQVKVRGFRIELGEVEAALLIDPAVRQALALVHESGTDGALLAAYAVAEPGAVIDVRALLERARTRVPEFMIPGAIVVLEAFPLTPNGKVDRRALPAPARAPLAGDRRARSPIEDLLATFYCDLLGLDDVSTEDGFFALGGHSLLAARLASRIRRSFDVELPLAAIFEQPTIAGLARIVANRRGGGEATIEPVERIDRNEDLPLSYPQERLWFLGRLDPSLTAYHLVSALRLRGPLKMSVFNAAYSALVARHEALRTRIVEVRGRGVQRVSPPGDLFVPLLDLAGLGASARATEVERAGYALSCRPFDLGAGRPLRIALLRLRSEDFGLILIVHHILADGQSLEILAHDLAALYRSLEAGARPDLPPLPVQYADFASWQRKLLEGERSRTLAEFWLAELADAPEVMPLPNDRPRPTVQRHRGAQIAFAAASDLSEALLRLARREGSTLFMVLLAAFKALLHARTGGTDLVIGTPVAYRPLLELEPVVGFFVNTLPLRSDLRGDPSFTELLGRIRGSVLDAFAHQDLPFDRLVGLLRRERTLGYNPLFQVGFTFLARPDAPPSLGAIKVGPLDLPVRTTPFDLNLVVADLAAGLEGSLQFNSDLFNRSTVEGLVSDLEAILGHVAGAPDCRLSELVRTLGALAEERRAAERLALSEGGRQLFARRVLRSQEEPPGINP